MPKRSTPSLTIRSMTVPQDVYYRICCDQRRSHDRGSTLSAISRRRGASRRLPSVAVPMPTVRQRTDGKRGYVSFAVTMNLYSSFAVPDNCVGQGRTSRSKCEPVTIPAKPSTPVIKHLRFRLRREYGSTSSGLVHQPALDPASGKVSNSVQTSRFADADIMEHTSDHLKVSGRRCGDY